MTLSSFPADVLPPPAPILMARYPSLKDRTVFVTGGATGIGAAIVSALALQAARVAFVDVNGDAAAGLAERLASQGAPAPWWRVVDVRDVTALQAAIAEAAADLGDFAVLVNNVAHDQRHALDEITPEFWEDRIAINQRPAVFAIQSVVPGMKRLGGGSIINMGSTGWQGREGGYPLYAMSKSSVNGLTRGLARPLGQHRIRINTLSPGWVLTERQLALWFTPEAARAHAATQCLPDRLVPDDIAQMVLFLAADDSRACTAQEFIVDGGAV